MKPAIVALAFLKANWEGRRVTYFDNFSVLVRECLRNLPDKVVSTEKLQLLMAEKFGVSISDSIIERILKKLKRDNVLIKEHGVYVLRLESLDEFEFEETRNEILKKWQELAKKLSQFAKQNYQKEWSETETEGVITSFLQNEGLRILSGDHNCGSQETNACDPSGKYVFASYVTEIRDSDPGSFSAVCTLIEASLLAEAMYFCESTEISASFKGTKVFLDTRFLLSALGYASAYARESRKEIMRLLSQYDAELCCFDHTIDEVKVILKACAQNLRGGQTYLGHGSSYEHFATEKFTETDVLRELGRLERNLRNLKIRTVSYSRLLSGEDKANKQELKRILDDEVHYSGLSALDKDINSILLTHKVRGSGPIAIVEKCVALFLSSNEAVVRAAGKFQDCLKENDDVDTIPLAWTVADLSTILWAKAPIRAPLLPRKKVIADCFAAIQPNESFRKRFLDAIDQLSKEEDILPDDVYVLRRDIELQRIAYDKVAGDEEAFCNGTVHEVLEYYRRRKIDRSVEERMNRIEEVFKRRAQQVAGAVSHVLFVAILIFLSIVCLNLLPNWTYLRKELFGVSARDIGKVVFFFLSLLGLFKIAPLDWVRRKTVECVAGRALILFKRMFDVWTPRG